MYLKDDKIIATIGPLTMRSSKVPSRSSNFVLDPTAVTGWTDGSNVRRSATPRPISHGDFPEKATLSARVISFSGTAVAATTQELQVMRDMFTGVLADGSYGELSVETSSGLRFATVGLEGTPSWVQQTDNVASWKIDFYAPDPRLYSAPNKITIGSASSTGGLRYPLQYPLRYGSDVGTVAASTITNLGNVEAWPIFVVTGDYFSGFEITDNLNRKVIYTGTVTMQAPVTIDMGRGAATQSGQDRSTLLTRRDWFSVAPNEVLRPGFTPAQSGNGWCDIIIRDTWI